MVEAAWGSSSDADIILFLYDAQKSRIDNETNKILDELGQSRKKKILVINKVDLVDNKTLLSLIKNFEALCSFHATFIISALTGEGSKEVLRYLAKNLPKGPWLYPEDEITDLPARLLAAEITREQIFMRLHQELPYATTVETEEWTERDDGAIVINQIIYLKKAGHKINVPFSPGRGDARQDQTDINSFGLLEPKADGFRNYLNGGASIVSAEEKLVDKAQLMGLTAPEMTVLIAVSYTHLTLPTNREV
mgnify:CR=1 FL=1